MYNFKEILENSQYDFSNIGVNGQSNLEMKNKLSELIEQGLIYLKSISVKICTNVNLTVEEHSKLFDTVFHLQYAVLWTECLPSRQGERSINWDLLPEFKIVTYILNPPSLKDCIGNFLFFLREVGSHTQMESILKVEIPKVLMSLLQRDQVIFLALPAKQSLLSKLLPKKDLLQSVPLINQVSQLLAERHEDLKYIKYAAYVYSLMLSFNIWIKGSDQGYLGFSCLNLSRFVQESFEFLFFSYANMNFLTLNGYDCDRILSKYPLKSPPPPIPSVKPDLKALLGASDPVYAVIQGTSPSDGAAASMRRSAEELQYARLDFPTKNMLPPSCLPPLGPPPAGPPPTGPPLPPFKPSLVDLQKAASSSKPPVPPKPPSLQPSTQQPSPAARSPISASRSVPGERPVPAPRPKPPSLP